VPRLYERAVHAGDVLAAAKVARIHEELYGVRRLLASVSNNVNQLTRSSNATGQIEGELSATLDLLRRTVDRLNGLLSRLPDGES